MVGILVSFLLGPGLFSGALAVSFREGSTYIYLVNPHDNYMGVSKNRGTPKWMVFMENPI